MPYLALHLNDNHQQLDTIAQWLQTQPQPALPAASKLHFTHKSSVKMMESLLSLMSPRHVQEVKAVMTQRLSDARRNTWLTFINSTSAKFSQRLDMRLCIEIPHLRVPIVPEQVPHLAPHLSQLHLLSR